MVELLICHLLRRCFCEPLFAVLSPSLLSWFTDKGLYQNKFFGVCLVLLSIILSLTMMSPEVVLVSLLSLVLVYSAAGLECRIYVSSSDGINNTSCWTGGVQTPCATIDLAIQGTAALQYNCSSGILINLSPGTYTLDTTSLLEQQVLRNNVSIIGMRDGSRYEEVSITCLHVSSSSYNWLRYIVFECVSLYNCNNVPVTCTEPSFDITTHNEPVLENEAGPNYKLHIDVIDTYLYCQDYYKNDNCHCDYVSFHAYIIDTSTNKQYNWKYDLKVCININSSFDHCYIISQPNCGYYIPDYRCYQVSKCFNDYIDAGPIKVTIYVQTLDVNNISASSTVNIEVQCEYGIGDCNPIINTCDINDPPYKLPCLKEDRSNCCYYNTTGEHYLGCLLEWGIPMNDPHICTECDEYGLLVFIVIEILPITIMVLLIIIFNIQLTNGSINGVVFYSQIISISYSVYFYYSTSYYYYYDYYYQYYFDSLTKIPCNVFNLDFTPFIYYVMCISPNTRPLGVISFWYVIGFYPLLLLLLLYVWITLYDKGYKCVVFITRPFHRCMARFWSMTGIEPSFTHSIASIYILCFTQLAATSFKILSIATKNETFGFNNTKFSYDMKQDYFKGVHGAAGSFAILVLLFLIVLPTLYILLYPFKWFHKLLDCLHLRKQLLISLGDVFTGPYKNGTENTYDYRFMAGLYLLAKAIILSQFIYVILMPFAQACCSFLLAVMVFIFRPFQRNIHNFTEFLIMFITAALGCINSDPSIMILSKSTSHFNDHYQIVFVILTSVIVIVNVLVFAIIIPGYIIYQVYKMIKSCHRYHKRNNPVANRNQEEDYQPLVGNDDDWIADRLENPLEYDEQHVPGRMYDVSEEDHQPITIGTAATYGSINEATDD